MKIKKPKITYKRRYELHYYMALKKLIEKNNQK